MSQNLIRIGFIINACFAGFLGLIVNCFENKLPSFVSKFLRHGKFCADVRNAFLEKLDVPKRWFKHFYAFAGPFSSVGLAVVFYRYFLSGKLPDVLASGFGVLLGEPVRSLVPAENVILAMSIFTIQCWKRFYESHFISVFSEQYMNFSMYVVGLYHYFGSVISVIGESQDLFKDTNVNLDWSKLSMIDWTCMVIFLVSTYFQYRSNIILSNLRKDKNGNVVTKKHKIPYGGLFEWVSAPLQLTEIILYICLSIILRSASTFHFVTLWVIANQVECAYLSHEWSLKKFEDYPKSRKVLVPYIF